MRKDPPFDTEYIYSTYILDRAKLQGALVVNDPFKPLFLFFFVMILMTPELPEASYLADGCVMISI